MKIERHDVIRAGILTCSNSRKRLEEDLTGWAVRKLLEKGSDLFEKKSNHPHLKEKESKPVFEVISHRIVPDKMARITGIMKKWCDQEALDLVLTTGGTGCSSTDVTPEATRKVISREVPGPAEMIRFFSLFHAKGKKEFPVSLLTRGVCGIRKKTFILNLPGSPRGAEESLRVVLPLLPHIIELMRRDP